MAVTDRESAAFARYERELVKAARQWRRTVDDEETARALMNRAVLRASSAPITVSDIARITGLSRPTIYKILRGEAVANGPRYRADVEPSPLPRD